MKIIVIVLAFVLAGCAPESFHQCDFNESGSIDEDDLRLQRGAFNTSNTLYDVNGDGTVLGDDIRVCSEAAA